MAIVFVAINILIIATGFVLADKLGETLAYFKNTVIFISATLGMVVCCFGIALDYIYDKICKILNRLT